MSRFKEFGIFLIDNKLKELDIPQKSTKGFMSIDLKSVTAFRPVSDDDDDVEELTNTLVFFGMQDSVIFEIKYDEFKKLMDEEH